MKKFLKVSALIMVLVFAFTTLVACGQNTAAPAATASVAQDTTVPAPAATEATKKDVKIGFACFMMSQEWYQSIANGAKARAKELGINLAVTDSNNDSNTQVNAIENFIAQKVDAIIVSPVDTKALGPVVQKATKAGIKIISESNFIEGTETMVGQTDLDSAKKAGTWFADYAKKNNIDPKILILGYKALENCRNRVEGFKKGMDEAGLKYQVLTEVDGGFREASMKAATDAFTAHPDINVIFGINDDSTLGAMAAVKAAKLDESKITAILYGLEGTAGRTALNEGGAYKAGLSMFPEYVGVACVDAAMDAINGKTLPKQYQSPTAMIDKGNFDKVFKKNGDKFELNFDAVKELMSK